MKTNADAKREMWKLVEETLRRYPQEEMEVVEGWFPDHLSISMKQLVAECPEGLFARYEEQDGVRRIFIRKDFGTGTMEEVNLSLLHPLKRIELKRLMATAKEMQQEFNERMEREVLGGNDECE